MKQTVIDASVAIKWVVPESHSDEAESVLAGDIDLLAQRRAERLTTAGA